LKRVTRLTFNFDGEFPPTFVAFVLDGHPIISLIVTDLSKLSATGSHNTAFEVQEEGPVLGFTVVLVVHKNGSLLVE